MDRIELRDFGEKGQSIHASRDFAPGEAILTFQGEETQVRDMHSVQIGINWHLNVGTPWKFVNHSCDPNCGIKEGVTLVALQAIKKGEEISFDYGMTESELSAPFDCLCGAVLCRGEVSGYVGLPARIKTKYEGFIAEYLTNPQAEV